MYVFFSSCILCELDRETVSYILNIYEAGIILKKNKYTNFSDKYRIKPIWSTSGYIFSNLIDMYRNSFNNQKYHVDLLKYE